MRHWIIGLAVVTSIAASPRPWPDTPAATVARQWVEAYSSEASMRAFLLKNVDEEALRQRTIEERIASYRESKKKFASLKLDSVVSSKPTALVVILTDAKGGKHEHTFTVRSAAPYKLLSITRKETRGHGHGLGLFRGH